MSGGTHFGGLLYQMGGVPVASGLGALGLAGGDVFFVDYGNGKDSYDGKSPEKAKKTLLAAYNTTVDGNNDCVVLIGNATSHQMSATITWAKSYTHLFGACANTRYGKRARLFHNADFSPMITVSGSGCQFENFYMSYGRAGADNHILMDITGNYNSFNGIHLAGMSHQTEGDDADSIIVNLEGTANTFNNCVFGNKNINRGAANTSLNLDGGGSGNEFKDCLFFMSADATSPTFVRTEDSSGFGRYIIFEDTKFINIGSSSLVQAFDFHAVDGNVNAAFITGNSFVYGCDDVADATGDGHIFFKPDTATANVALLATAVAVA